LSNFLKQIWAHSGFQRYLKNTGWLFGGQMLRMILGLLVGVAVARYLGPEDFGLYSYILSIIALITVFGQLGIQNIAKRELIAHPDKKNTILGTCFVINAISGTLLYCIMLLFLLMSKGSQHEHIALYTFLGAGLLLMPFDHIEMWFQAQVQAKLSVTASIIAMLIGAGIKVLAIYSGWSLLSFAVISCFELGTLAFIKTIFYRRHYGPILAWGFSMRMAEQLLHESWPLLISAVAITVYMQIDQVMLGSMLGNQAVGEYAAASRLSSVWNFIPVLLANSLYPAIIKSKEISESLYMKRIQQFMDLNAILAYLIILPITLLSPYIIEFLYGESYKGAAPILTIHVWAALFVFMGVARGQYLLTEKMHKFSLVATCAGAILNVGLNYILIPIYGGTGAAFATLISYSTSAYVSSLFWRPMKQVLVMQTKALLIVNFIKTIHDKSIKNT
jgi:O-antigen/teichoic acid export membrane protein